MIAEHPAWCSFVLAIPASRTYIALSRNYICFLFISNRPSIHLPLEKPNEEFVRTTPAGASFYQEFIPASYNISDRPSIYLPLQNPIKNLH
jgi:hypothetical protein